MKAYTGKGAWGLAALLALLLAAGVGWLFVRLRPYWIAWARGYQADLQHASLPGARLAYADLREAQLRRADLRNALLRGANLMGADLGFALLNGADLTGARLWNADLR